MQKLPNKTARLAYQLWLAHHSFADIAARLHAKQSDVIRAVNREHIRQQRRCISCEWRKDGLETCLLPVCMYGVGRPRTKRRRNLWIKKRF